MNNIEDESLNTALGEIKSFLLGMKESKVKQITFEVKIDFTEKTDLKSITTKILHQ